MALAELTLLKVGGAELEEGAALEALTEAIAQFVAERNLIIVHGGGSDIAKLQKRLGLVPRFIDGLRVTDEESLWAAEMALSGTVNKRLTAHLVQRGVRALGLSGVDAGLLRARPLAHPKGDLGRVGEIEHVETSCLLDLLAKGFIPVISPISLGSDGHPFNVNADHAALAIAKALHVHEMIFLTNVPGVLVQGELLAQIDPQTAEKLIATGEISGGMIPKVRSALAAIAQGVQTVRITNLEGLFQGSGTRFSTNQER